MSCKRADTWTIFFCASFSSCNPLSALRTPTEARKCRKKFRLAQRRLHGKSRGGFFFVAARACVRLLRWCTWRGGGKINTRRCEKMLNNFETHPTSLLFAAVSFPLCFRHGKTSTITTKASRLSTHNGIASECSLSPSDRPTSTTTTTAGK